MLESTPVSYFACMPSSLLGATRPVRHFVFAGYRWRRVLPLYFSVCVCFYFHTNPFKTRHEDQGSFTWRRSGWRSRKGTSRLVEESRRRFEHHNSRQGGRFCSPKRLTPKLAVSRVIVTVNSGGRCLIREESDKESTSDEDREMGESKRKLKEGGEKED